MKFIKLLFFTVFPLAIFSQTENNLQNQVSELLTEQNLTGVVWSTVSDNDEINIYSSGIKNNDTNEKLKPSNAIQVGSITKSVLAMGILRLITENKLNLDDSIQEYIPELNFNNPWKKNNPITVRHLLDHTSGLSDLAIWHFFSTSSEPNTPLISAFKNNENLLDVHTKPGTVFSYSNMGYTLLGMVIEKVTDNKYEGYLDENFLKPLGMKHSTFQFVSQVGKKANKNLAMGHFEDGSTVASAQIYLRPAAQFTTTAYDMGLFLKFMMSDGSINGIPFINSKYLEQLGHPNSTIAAKNGLNNGYSLGVLKKDWHSRISLSHSGNIIGYKAYYYVFPKENKALFISYNIDHETADYNKINRLLIDNLTIATKKPSKKILKTEEVLKSWNGYYIPVFSKAVPFRLLDYLGSFTKVKVLDKGADIIPFQKKKRNLNYSGKNLFSSNKGLMPSYLFYKDKQGSLFITTGISTIKQTNGITILLVFISFILGIIGLLYLFINGIIKTIRNKKEFLTTPLVWSFLSIIILLLAIQLITFQPFMEIGNLTAGTILLAISSVLLPICTIVSIILLVMNKHISIKSINFLSLICILQFSILLFFFGLTPIILWN